MCTTMHGRHLRQGAPFVTPQRRLLSWLVIVGMSSTIACRSPLSRASHNHGHHRARSHKYSHVRSHAHNLDHNCKRLLSMMMKWTSHSRAHDLVVACTQCSSWVLV